MLLQVQREKDRVKSVDITLRQTRGTCNSGYLICRHFYGFTIIIKYDIMLQENIYVMWNTQHL